MRTTLPRKTILIADDHVLLAEGIARLLSADYEVVGLAPNGRQLVNDAIRNRPDLITLDISMPGLNGIEAAKQLIMALPNTKLIFVTQQSDPQYIRAAFAAGASGYVTKESASDELLIALRQAILGKPYLSPALQETVGFAPISELKTKGSQTTNTLTARQREVLQLISEGKTTRQISEALKVSPKTVEFHKRALMDQTGLRTAAELTRYAIANGIVSI